MITEDGIIPVCLLFAAFLCFCRLISRHLKRKRRSHSRRVSGRSADVPESETVPALQIRQEYRLNASVLFPLFAVTCSAVVGYLYHSNSAVPAGLVTYREGDNIEIPQSLLDFKSKYPEASDFVDNYPLNKDREYSMDVSGEVQAGTIPLFIQWDERWGYKIYGDDFLAVDGCGPTCISMVVCGLTGNTQWNPYEVALFSAQSGYYVPETGTSWELMTTGAENLGLRAESGYISADYIFDSLYAGQPLICSMTPGDFTYSGHFIVLTGIDSDGYIIVNDPNSKNNSSRHWDVDTLLSQIKGIWSYSNN
ncbi:MAG: papain-like cysteine protease family protein [Eubacteriales bacterium]|nr:papain-like cysteine protease family protein [Eubacteriales bacterium]